MALNRDPRAALALLTALNFLNYVDRSVLFAVQPLVQQEFHRNDADLGLLTTAFFFCYMFAAPAMGWLADRYPRRVIIAIGAIVWSGATLLTAVTRDFGTLLFRHTIVGIGEASFATIAPAFLSDLFPEHRRGRILAVFYLTIGLGTAGGYMLGGALGPRYGWRVPFYVAAAPGFVLALLMFSVAEPLRGAADQLRESRERISMRGLVRNGAFWTATLGMAMMTFSLGGLSVWMPTFLSRMRSVPLDRANWIFGAITGFNAIVATLLGGWIGDRVLRRTSAAHYLVSGISMGIGLPAMIFAVHGPRELMWPAIFVAEFLLFLNTGPLNAAVVNSVGANIRARAVAVNLFVIHLLGDAFSPRLIGHISDHSNLQTGFFPAFIATALSSAVLFYGMRFAPRLSAEQPQRAGALA